MNEAEMVIVGVDPGGTTGIAVWSPIAGLALTEHKPEAAVEWLASLAEGTRRKHFVVERYIITPATAKMSQQHDALEIIGALKYLVKAHGHSMSMQSPSEAKAFSTDDKLKNIGWYEPGKGHARDASRHVLLYLAKRNIIDLHTLRGGMNAGL